MTGEERRLTTIPADELVDTTDRPPLWTCPSCGHRFISANIWHSCSRHTVDELFAKSSPAARAGFDRLVQLYERCGPIVVIAQKTRIVFMVRVRFGGCVVRRDHIVASIALARRVEHPRWRSVEQIVPNWIAHRLVVRDGSELDDPSLAELICESYHQMGEQGRLSGLASSGSGDST
jgi:hypothetical protein